MAVIGLVHGMGGTAATMAPLADALTAAGHEVHVVTLPGHGTAPEDLEGVRWGDWLDAVPHTEVLVGQSMGGTLALAAAARDPRIRAVVAVNPPVADEDALEGLEWRQSRGHRWVDAPELGDGEAGYARLPVDALVEMVRGVHALDLATVTVPVLLVHGALDDSAEPGSLDALAEHLAGPVHRLTLPNTGHVATLGPDVALLAATITHFLR